MRTKFTFSFLALFLLGIVGFAQQIQMPQASPSAKITQQVGLTSVTVDYSRPSVKGRKIFGELVPFGQVWRTGANNATIINFSTPVTMGGKEIPSGSYALYTIPDKSEWTIVLSKNTELWGAIGYSNADDVVRFQVESAKTSKKYETFEITFNNIKDNGADISIKWENTRVDIPMTTEVDPIVMADIQKQVIDAKTTDPSLLYQAANYYYTNRKDMKQALEWIQQSTDADPKYWTMHLRAKIELAMGQKTEAYHSADKSKAMAKEAQNPDYVGLNERLMKSIK